MIRCKPSNRGYFPWSNKLSTILKSEPVRCFKTTNWSRLSKLQSRVQFVVLKRQTVHDKDCRDQFVVIKQRTGHDFVI